MTNTAAKPRKTRPPKTVKPEGPVGQIINAEGEVEVKRGNVYFAELDGVGSEQMGFRPVIIVQNNTGNRHSPTVLEVPITTKAKKALPTHCSVMFNNTVQTICCEQLRCVDKQRLGRFVGRATPETMESIDRALGISVGIHQKGTCE